MPKGCNSSGTPNAKVAGEPLALKESQEEIFFIYSTIIRDGLIVLYKKDPSQGLTFLSSNVERLLGFSPEEFYRNKGLLEAQTYTEDLVKVREMWQRAIALKEDFYCQYRLIHRNGKATLWVRDHATPYQKKDGRLLYHGLIEDITEIKTQVDFLDNILSHTGALVRVVEPETHRVIYENQPLREKLGDGLGRSCYVLWERKEPCEICLGKEAIKSGELVRREIKTTEGTLCAAYVIPLRNADGTVSSVVEMMRDITEVRKLQEEIHAKELIAERERVIRNSLMRTVEALSVAIEEKDPYTMGHCERIVKYAVEIARRMGLSEEFISWLRCAGYLHDVGKIGIPRMILIKPGKLNAHEWNVIRTHPSLGVRIISPMRGTPEIEEIVIPSVKHHHEHFDGTGYPDGLEGKVIPLGARIIGTVDVYDALVTERPYRKALSRENALELMRKEKGKTLDPEITDMLIKIIKSEPAEF